MRQEYLYALIRNKCVVKLNTRRNRNKMLSKIQYNLITVFRTA
jgi:hypothetical protein